MRSSASAETSKGWDGSRFATGIGRGFAGALIFALPMFMTMEMWELGFSMNRLRLLLLLVLNIPLLIILSDRVGFEETTCWRDAVRDAMIAYAIGILSSLVILFSVAVLKLGQPLSEMVGKVAVQSVPASIGALLGRSQLNGDVDDSGESDDPVQTTVYDYAGELFLMALGALFLGLNVAPTEEMILLSYKMTPLHALAVVILSLVIMHGFVYAVSFKGGHEIGDEVPRWHTVLRFTLPGYVIALLVSAYTLWTFQRFDDAAVSQMLLTTIVLGLPCSIGAAAARLIL
ncbi:TIGR02587 family membrane protein [Rhizobium sp. S152]|uniref:TIGR02587 family membrane protein n=1 Tax=Rhizobium sp. S152 TaxID=3055038 RepID=UPI0025AA008F|nr:TIGR02587 family membrane protein [Rhizobium sp. S152]MDM9627885.1 TIGR02587 family membrane protein [Rhizobium sp. S152]